MIRRRIGSIVMRAYPSHTRRERGVEMVDTLLDASEHSRRAFITGCMSLVSAGLVERGRHGTRHAVAGVAVAACGAGAAVALTIGNGSPTMTGGQAARVPIAWFGMRQRAFARVADHGGACRISVNPHLGAQRLLEGAPPTQLSSMLAVLRQPAPAYARISASRLGQLDLDAQGIYIRYARQGVADGITYYVIPAADVGEDPMPERCYAEQLNAFESEADRLPAAQRPKAIAWERQLIKQWKGPTPGVAVITAGAGGIGGTYMTVDRLRNHFWGGEAGDDNITETALLLPDGVASVTARYPTQTYPGRVARPVTITRQVTNNLAVFVFRGAWDPPKLTYRTAAGAILWSTPRT